MRRETNSESHCAGLEATLSHSDHGGHTVSAIQIDSILDAIRENLRWARCESLPHPRRLLVACRRYKNIEKSLTEIRFTREAQLRSMGQCHPPSKQLPQPGTWRKELQHKCKGGAVKSFDNQGRLLNETTTRYTSDGRVISTSTTYYSPTGRVTSQIISVRDKDGKVNTTNVLGGKLLP